MPPRKTIPFEGVLNCWNDEYDLPDLLLAVSRSGKTGRLLFRNAEGDKTLYVKDGRVVFAESSSADDGLGEYLLRIGRISLRDYTRVSKRIEPGKRMGALLVAEGVLGPKELVPVVTGQVRSIILGLFRRTETWYGFKAEELSRKESITLDMPVAQLLVDGVRYVESWRRISKGVGAFESVYRLASSSQPEWSRLKLEEDVNELLSMLTEPSSVADLCARSRMPDFEACRYLWIFRALEWIEPAEISPAVEVPAAEEAAPEKPPKPAPPLALEPAPAPPPVPAPVPVVAAPDLSSTVLDVSLPPRTPAPPARSPIPQHLVRTRVAAPAKDATPPKRALGRPLPEALAQTRMVVDAPSPFRSGRPAPPEPPPPQSQVTTLPSVTPPKPIATDLLHTQMYVEPRSQPLPVPEPAAPSTGEMMEAILDEGEDRIRGGQVSSQTPPGSTHSNSATRFFAGASALEPPPPREREVTRSSKPGSSSSLPEDSYEDYFPSDLSSGFDSLSLEYDPAPASEAPVTVPSLVPEGNETRVAFDPPSFGETPQSFDPPPDTDAKDEGIASFQDLALSDSSITFPAETEPEPEAEVEVEAKEESAVPVVEADLATPEPVPPIHGGGMELLAMTDPFGRPSPSTESPIAIETDDPLQPTVAASLPRRKRSEELELDSDALAKLLRGDERRQR